MSENKKKTFNEEQQQAIDQTEGPLLIIAGAGSGKTTVLSERTVNMIKKGIDPRHILMLTFTNKAAKEMKDRGERLIGPDFQNITACTYHSLCCRIVRTYANQLGIPRFFSILINDSDLWDLIIGKSKNPFVNAENERFPKGDLLAKLYSLAFNRNMEIEDIIEEQCPGEIPAEYIPAIKELKLECETYKRDHAWMTFDDLMEKTIYLLSNYPDVQKLLMMQYHYIMVDEYQDSNLPQLRILKLLCGDKPMPNICAVGDAQQSIYLFRGAEVQNILNFSHDFPGGRTIILDKNYRSNQEILDVANSITEDIPEEYKATMVGTHYKESLPKLVQTYSSSDENEWIVKEMIRQHDSGIPWHEMAVLSRTGRSTFALEALMTKNQIPYDKFGGLKLTDMRFVKDIMYMFKCMMDMTDEISWFCILQLLPGVSTVNALKMFEQMQKERSVSGISSKAFAKRKYYQDYVDFVDFFNGLAGKDFKEQYARITNYYWVMRNRLLEVKGENKRTKMENLESDQKQLQADKKLCKAILDEIAKDSNTHADFMDNLSLDSLKSNIQSEDRAVISTVHSAKGLEYSTVFVYECIEKCFPLTCEGKGTLPSDIYAKKVMEEELRILYVAVTRAKDSLYVMWPLKDARGTWLKTESGTSELNRYLISSVRNDLFDIIDVY